MSVHVPEPAVEVLAYPLQRVPCPHCTRPYPTPPRAMADAPARCERCNGAGVVYRPAPTLRVCHERTDP